jgi:tetratricopeptide (TPR) repeat protein
MSVSYFPTRRFVSPAAFLLIFFLISGSIPQASSQSQAKTAPELKKEGTEQYIRGDYLKAIETFKKMEGATNDPALLSQAYLYISMSYYCLEEYEKAKEWLNKSLETVPEIESTGLIFPPGYDTFYKEAKDAKAVAPKAKPEARKPVVKAKAQPGGKKKSPRSSYRRSSSWSRCIGCCPGRRKKR